jgi:hypothetical protein
MWRAWASVALVAGIRARVLRLVRVGVGFERCRFATRLHCSCSGFRVYDATGSLFSCYSCGYRGLQRRCGRVAVGTCGLRFRVERHSNWSGCVVRVVSIGGASFTASQATGGACSSLAAGQPGYCRGHGSRGVWEGVAETGLATPHGRVRFAAVVVVGGCSATRWPPGTQATRSGALTCRPCVDVDVDDLPLTCPWRWCSVTSTTSVLLCT